MVHPRHPAQTGVDHRPHAGNRQAALGDGRGQDHPPARTGAQRRVLHRAGLAAVQRDHLGLDAGQAMGHRVDLAGAGQEDEHVAVALGERPAGRGGHVVEQARVDAQPQRRRDRTGGRDPVLLDREDRRRGGHDGRRAEHLGEPARVGRRRGGQQLKIGAQGRAHLDQERQRQIGVEMPLVTLVEDHR
jgi:hypothetical protein